MTEPDVNPIPGSTRNQFGTFTGVFTPTILTMFGVVMYMTTGTVIGFAGWLTALLILAIAKSITSLTSLSLSAISTNTEVKGGGVYYLTSRSLGPEFGGAIGAPMYLALAFSTPFNIIGVVESLKGFDALRDFFQLHYAESCIAIACIFFAINWFGAKIALKLQFFILGILSASIIAFLIGLMLNFDVSRFVDNIGASSTVNQPSFWTLFAMFFPAVSGIMVGVSMSGDLKEPNRSIPKGTLLAVGVGALVYGVQILLMAGGMDRGSVGGESGTLIESPYIGLKRSVGSFGFLVPVGALAATASSALGFLAAAPRVLQAIARDNIFPILKPFAKGTLKGDEPRRALTLTFLLTVVTLLIACAASSNALNSVAAILSMFFLASYGTVNASVFVEAFGRNPSFRPRFKFFHWSTALAGMAVCLAAALIINWIPALIAALAICLIYVRLLRSNLKVSFGDARRGYAFSQARDSLLKLRDMRPDAKNWRPIIIALTGNPDTRYTLIKFANWLEAGRGMLTLVNFIIGDIRDKSDERREREKALAEFIRTHNFPAFTEVTVAPCFDDALPILLQSHSLHPIRPNAILLGWSGAPERAAAFIRHLTIARRIGLSVFTLIDRGAPDLSKKPRIDIWWRGRENGSLMLILAYLMKQTLDWRAADIRMMRTVRDEAKRLDTTAELTALAHAGRIDAVSDVIVTTESFADVLKKKSSDASVVFLGFQIPDEPDSAAFHQRFATLTESLPTTILVCSTGEADLLA